MITARVCVKKQSAVRRVRSLSASSCERSFHHQYVYLSTTLSVCKLWTSEIQPYNLMMAKVLLYNDMYMYILVKLTCLLLEWDWRLGVRPDGALDDVLVVLPDSIDGGSHLVLPSLGSRSGLEGVCVCVCVCVCMCVCEVCCVNKAH